ncbi:MAG: hypothetical protein ACLUNZ_13405 [Evtepia sp.]
MDCGFDLVSGGTDNHLMLVDLRAADITGKEMEKRLDQVNITVNKNTIPDDPRVALRHQWHPCRCSCCYQPWPA